MANAVLQEETHDNDNETDDEGSPMFATLSVNSQDSTRSRAQSSHRKRFKSDEYIVVGIEKLFQRFTKPTNMSQNMHKSSEDHDYIVEQLVSIRLLMDDELMALNLMVENPSNINAFKVL